MKRKILFILTINLLCISAIVAENKFFPDENSYFPLLPGSYWKYQDSCFSDECEQIVSEDVGVDPRMIFFDTVVNLEKKQNKWEALVLSFLGKKRKGGVKTIYQCDSTGRIFQGIFSIKAGLEMDDLNRLNLFPNQIDTVYQYGMRKYPQNYQFDKFYECYFLTMLGENDTTYFKKGIGLFERKNNTSTHHLLEYRIGNGPVIKLRKPR